VPLHGAKDIPATDAALRASMTALLHRAQQQYPHPAGAYWVPRRLGGSAPSPDDSRQIRLTELADRAKRYGQDRVTPQGRPKADHTDNTSQ